MGESTGASTSLADPAPGLARTFGWVLAVFPWLWVAPIVLGVPGPAVDGQSNETTALHVLGVLALYLGWVGLFLRGPWWGIAVHLQGRLALRGAVEMAGWITLCVLGWTRVHAYVAHFGTFGPGG